MEPEYKPTLRETLEATTVVLFGFAVFYLLLVITPA